VFIFLNLALFFSLRFLISLAAAHSIISKLIISEELAASWDQPTGALLIHTHDPSPLQLQALNYADKINILLESVDGSEQRSFEHRKMVAATSGLGRMQAPAPQGQAGKKPTASITAPPSVGRKPVTAPPKVGVTQERGFTTRDRRAKKAGNTFKK
jgi:hypothetical protein